jgi:hypothetical protein
MQSLFPTAAQQGATPFVEFKAGRITMTPTEEGSENKKVKCEAETTSGSISLVKKNGTMMFQWIDRSSGDRKVVDEFVIMGDEATFKKVKTGKDDDRVVLLRWKDDTRRCMFWMQSKDASKDEENTKKVADILKNPASAQHQGQGGGPGGGLAGLAGRGGLGNNAALLQMLGLQPPPEHASAGQEGASSSGAGATAAATTANNDPAGTVTATFGEPPQQPPAPSAGAFGALDLSSLLGAGAGAGAGASAAAGTRATRAPLRLESVVNADSILESGILSDAEVRAELLQFLPEGQRSDAQLETNIRSPQFSQAIQQFSAALHDQSNFASICASFGLDPSSASATPHLLQGDGVRAFIAALQASSIPAAAAAAADSDSSQHANSSPPPPPSSSSSSEQAEGGDKMEE